MADLKKKPASFNKNNKWNPLYLLALCYNKEGGNNVYKLSNLKQTCQQGIENIIYTNANYGLLND